MADIEPQALRGTAPARPESAAGGSAGNVPEAHQDRNTDYFGTHHENTVTFVTTVTRNGRPATRNDEVTKVTVCSGFVLIYIAVFGSESESRLTDMQRYLQCKQVLHRMLIMKKRRIKLSDQVRRAVDACGMTRYRIAKKLDISEATMSRFMAAKVGLSMEYLDALADLLELDIKAPERRLNNRKGNQ
jgi:hypothetical protein